MSTPKTQRITLTLKLRDAIIISQKSATEGMHQSLDYIPGSNFLGAIASQLYRKFKTDKTCTVFELFHSGKVRFANAYPMQDAQPSYPVPLSFHQPKEGGKSVFYNRLFSVDKAQQEQQLKQKREGYLTANKQLITPARHLHLKTAIDSQTGTAKESQLFGYQSLQAGGRYQTHIDIDNEATAHTLFSELKRLKQIRVGRSKTAQYGRIDIEEITLDTQPAPIITPVSLTNQESIVLWLASDLVAYNCQGQPTLAPSLKALDLLPESAPDIPLDLARSWLRSRRYSPYNGYRQSYDLEKQVICQGSVLVYPAEGVDITHLQQQLRYGIGCYTESGHGQVVPQTSDWQFIFEKTYHKVDAPADMPKQSALSGLVQKLQERYTQQQTVQRLHQQIAQDLQAFIQLYQRARDYQATPAHLAIGPSNTQWGRLRNELTKQRFESKAQLFQFLFEGESAMIQPKDEAWSVGTHQHSFADLLKQKLNAVEDSIDITFYLRVLAREAAHSPELNAARGANV